MNAAEFAYYVRYKTRTNSTTFTDTEMKALMKVRQDELAKDILKADEKILLIPQTQTLTVSVRHYAYPTNFLSRIARVEAKLDGTNWIKLNEERLESFTLPLTETNITNHYSNLQGEAAYFIHKNGIYILSGSITTVANGLSLWTNIWPTAVTDLTSSTGLEVSASATARGIPRELHEIWARGVIIDYKESREKPIPLTERELKYEYDKRVAISVLKRQNEEREIIGEIPNQVDRGNEGAEF